MLGHSISFTGKEKIVSKTYFIESININIICTLSTFKLEYYIVSVTYFRWKKKRFMLKYRFHSGMIKVLKLLKDIKIKSLVK